MPSLAQLEYVIAVDKHRHFGRAAERCHVTQPTLSTQIQKVEDEIGYAIFDRLKKPVAPTPRGRRFIAQAQGVLNEYRKLVDLARAEDGTLAGELKLGIIPTVAPYLLPLFVETFSAAHPRIELSIDELKTETILERLADGSLDAAVLATPLEQPGLIERPLYYEPFSLYVASADPLHARKRIREEDLDASKLWLLGDGHCFRTQVARFCDVKRSVGVFGNLRFEGGTIDTLRHLVRRSRGYTLVPALFVDTLPAPERREHVREFEYPRPTREVSLIFRRDHWKADLLTALAETIVARVPSELREKDERRHEVLRVR